MTARTGQLGQNSQDRKTVAGQPAEDSHDKIVAKGQLEHVNLNSSASKVSLNRSDWTDREASWTRHLGQDNCGRTDMAGKIQQDS
jgi:hypothetical protein